MKTGNSRKIIGAALCLCAVVLAGCSDESEFSGIAETSLGIGFEVTLKGGEEETAQTRSTLGTKVFNENLYLRTTVTENEENPFTAAQSRATEVTEDAFHSTFGVYAYIYDSSENWSDSPSANLYITDGTVTQSGETWAFDPTRYWPPTDYQLTFFAYAPKSLGEGADGSLEVSLDGTSNLPQIAYTVPSSYAEQKDLVVARTTDQTKSGSSVPLEFNHILTAVQVKCKSIPAGTIKQISFSGIKNQGTYDLAEGSWTLKSGTTSYEIEGEFTAADNAEILTGDYTLMLLPQRLGEDATLTVTYTPDGDDGEEKTLKASLYQEDLDEEEQDWEPGKKVTYLIRYRDLNGYDAVDLGLSVVWATRNVGASSETDYGDYYEFGEIMTRYTEGYSDSHSTWYGKSVTEGTIKGNPLYDVARSEWGGTWRLPTDDEIAELINNCTWTWETDGVKGMTVTSEETEKSIFLPAAGYWRTSLHQDGSYGHYWSCSPIDTYNAYGLDFNFNNSSPYLTLTSSTSYYGYSVRPVSE